MMRQLITDEANFDPLQNQNPWLGCQKLWHCWLHPQDDPHTKFGENLFTGYAYSKKNLDVNRCGETGLMKHKRFCWSYRV